MVAATLYTLQYKQQKMAVHASNIHGNVGANTVQNDQLCGFPCMNINSAVKDIRRYLAPYPAMAKGRMKKPTAGIRSIRNKKKVSQNVDMELDVEDMHPTDGSTMCRRGQTQKYTMYINATGALPVRFLNGKSYYVVICDYHNNYVNEIPVSDL